MECFWPYCFGSLVLFLWRCSSLFGRYFMLSWHLQEHKDNSNNSNNCFSDFFANKTICILVVPLPILLYYCFQKDPQKLTPKRLGKRLFHTHTFGPMHISKGGQQVHRGAFVFANTVFVCLAPCKCIVFVKV